MRPARVGGRNPVGRRYPAGNSGLDDHGPRTTLRKHTAVVRSGPPYDRLTEGTAVTARAEGKRVEHQTFYQRHRPLHYKRR